jgi:hypothetical protein
MNDRTNDRTIERTNEQTKNRWTNDQRTTDRTILVLVCACVGDAVGVWGRERVAIKWLGVA